jgi:hypothetical protein
VVVTVVKSLRELGLPAKNISIFERYADNFELISPGRERVAARHPSFHWGRRL